MVRPVQTAIHCNSFDVVVHSGLLQSIYLRNMINNCCLMRPCFGFGRMKLQYVTLCSNDLHLVILRFFFDLFGVHWFSQNLTTSPPHLKTFHNIVQHRTTSYNIIQHLEKSRNILTHLKKAYAAEIGRMAGIARCKSMQRVSPAVQVRQR